MITSLLTRAAGGAAALTAAVTRTRRKSTARRRNQRASGADPYAGQRRPEKLNPGLGGCASGGG